MSGVRYGEKHQRQERQSEVSLQAESFGCRIYAEYLERGRAPGLPRTVLRDFDFPPHTRCGESKVSPSPVCRLQPTCNSAPASSAMVARNAGIV